MLEQVKYSTADSNKLWTVARLVAASNQQKTNSAIRHLAKAYKAIAAQNPALSLAGKITVRLVSNQAVAQAVCECLATNPGSQTAHEARAKLQATFPRF